MAKKTDTTIRLLPALDPFYSLLAADGVDLVIEKIAYHKDKGHWGEYGRPPWIEWYFEHFGTTLNYDTFAYEWIIRELRVA